MIARLTEDTVRLDRETATNSKISNDARLIAAAVAGGLAVFIIGALILFFLRRHRRQHRHKVQRMDIIDVDNDADDSTGPVRQDELLHLYMPTPLPLTDLSVKTGSTYSTWTPPDTPYTAASLSRASLMPGTISGKGVPRSPRGVQYVQHDDAGPSTLVHAADAQESQTIEIPPRIYCITTG